MVASYARPRGIDVSKWQPNTDWNAVKNSGIEFACTKLTEGTYYYNEWFQRDWEAQKTVGIQRCAYHFAKPSINSDPTPEVYFFLDSLQSQVDGLKQGDCLALDMEDVEFIGDASGWSLFFMQILENIVGFKPIFYSGPWYLNSRLQNRPITFKEYPLWLGNYNAIWPETPKPWDTITIWQHSEEGSVPGVQGDCDLDYFNGTMNRFPLLGAPKDIDLSANEPPPPVIVPPTPTFDKEALKQNMLLRIDTLQEDIIGKVNEQVEILKQALIDEIG